MNDNEILDILKLVIDKIKGKQFLWRVEGSANLRILGVDVVPNDFDITTSKEGVKIFREVLKEFIVKEVRQGDWLVLKLLGSEVDIHSYNDAKFEMLDKIKKIKWRGIEVPILPLPYAKKFYELINRQEKVEIIEKHLKK